MSGNLNSSLSDSGAPTLAARPPVHRNIWGTKAFLREAEGLMRSRIMRTSLCLLTAVSALCMAAPAAAQYRDYRGAYGADSSFDVRIDNLRARLDAGLRAGTISRREAWTLRRQLRDLEVLEARYSINGFTSWERSDLNARLRTARRDQQEGKAPRMLAGGSRPRPS